MARKTAGTHSNRPATGRSRRRPGETIGGFWCEYKTSLTDYGEGEVCVAEYEGVLKVTVQGGDPDLDAPEHTAGTTRLFVVNGEAALNEGYNLQGVLDFSGETAAYLPLFDEDSGSLSQAVARILEEEEDERYCENFLILDRLEILPKFRGQKLGLRYLRAAILRFGMGCRFAAIKPFPLQFEGRFSGPRGSEPGLSPGALQEMQKACEAATKKLRNYYAPLGFVGVKGTELMILDLRLRLPKVR
jgi:hypothetical protein